MLSLFDFSSNTEYITVDFDSKRGNVIKLAGTTDEPYFCGKDVCMILEYENIKVALFKNVEKEYKKELKALCGISSDKKLGKYVENISYHDGKAIYINLKGLKMLLQKSKKADPRVVKILCDKIGLNLNLVMFSKEQRNLSDILTSFPFLSYTRQLSVGNYRVDLYFPEINTVVECDEFGHVGYNQNEEKAREEYIKAQLKCEFLRFNPDNKYYDIFEVIGKISTIIYKKYKPTNL